ncbi:MAG: hypothetical protein ACRDSR_16550 [Pseudonocardiaceae bacterium]
MKHDLLAGRAGTSSTRRTRLLLPMRFRDVLAATGRAVPTPGPLASWELQGDAAGACELFADELHLAMNRAACAEALGYASRHVFDTRLNRLTTAFAAVWSHQVDLTGRRIVGSQTVVERQVSD